MYFIITSPKGFQFKAYYQSKKDKLLIGGEKYACIEISYNDLDLYADGTRKVSCFLNILRDTLPDTKELVKASIYFLKYIKPDSCYLDLTDASNKEGNMLAYSGIFFNDKTWYEKHFQAKLIKEDNINSYTILKSKLKSTEFKNLVDFIGLLKDSKVPQEKINILEELFNESDTLQDFGQIIYNKYKNRDDVYELLQLKLWLSPLFKGLLQGDFLLDNRWKILCENVDTEGFTIKETEKFELISIKKKSIPLVQIGGRKLTERNKESLKNPNWIMWKDLEMEEYSQEDQKYLKKHLREFEVMI